MTDSQIAENLIGLFKNEWVMPLLLQGSPLVNFSSGLYCEIIANTVHDPVAFGPIRQYWNNVVVPYINS